MSIRNYYGNDYQPCLPTMDMQTFKPVEGISWAEWDLILKLHSAYRSIRYTFESLKGGGHDADRFQNNLARVRKDLAGLLNDAINEIEARRDVRIALGYAGGGSIAEMQSSGMTLDDACQHAASEVCEQMGLAPKDKALKSLKKRSGNNTKRPVHRPEVREQGLLRNLTQKKGKNK